LPIGTNPDPCKKSRPRRPNSIGRQCPCPLIDVPIRAHIILSDSCSICARVRFNTAVPNLLWHDPPSPMNHAALFHYAKACLQNADKDLDSRASRFIGNAQPLHRVKDPFNVAGCNIVQPVRPSDWLPASMDLKISIRSFSRSGSCSAFWIFMAIEEPNCVYRPAVICRTVSPSSENDQAP